MNWSSKITSCRGIGSGLVGSPDDSFLNFIEVHRYVLSVVSSSPGSGIGSGFSELGISQIDRVALCWDSFAILGSDGSGIDTGKADDGVSAVCKISPRNCTMNADNSSCVGIGCGSSDSSLPAFPGATSIDKIEIVGDQVTARSLLHGSGIGSSSRTITHVPISKGIILEFDPDVIDSVSRLTRVTCELPRFEEPLNLKLP
jgi:hypothetical protein